MPDGVPTLLFLPYICWNIDIEKTKCLPRVQRLEFQKQPMGVVSLGDQPVLERVPKRAQAPRGSPCRNRLSATSFLDFFAYLEKLNVLHFGLLNQKNVRGFSSYEASRCFFFHFAPHSSAVPGDNLHHLFL
jgi:hypothetical protein